MTGLPAAVSEDDPDPDDMHCAQGRGDNDEATVNQEVGQRPIQNGNLSYLFHLLWPWPWRPWRGRGPAAL